MATIRHLSRALFVAAVLGVPAFASADATALCDHEKAEQKAGAPTAEKSDQKQDKAKKSEDGKTDPKTDDKQSDKS